MSELGQQLFLKSRDQYEAAIRWAFVLVIIGVVVHVTIFSRAVEIQTDLSLKRTALEELTSVQETAEELPTRVAAFNESIMEQERRVDQRTTEWFEDLKLRMAQLNALLEPGYRGVAPVEASASSPTSPMQQAQQHVQQNGSPDTSTEVLEVRNQLREKFEEAGLDEQLEGTTDPSARFERVAHFVNEHVIPPSFERLNRRWTVPDRLREEARALEASIRSVQTATESPDLKRALQPEQVEVLRTKTESLGELRGKIDSAVTVVEGLRFVAPEGDKWWRSVEGKGEERLEMAADAKQRLGRIRSLQASKMEEVIAELRRAARRQEDATKSLNKELKELEQQLKKGTTELAGMGVGWIPIGGDIGGFVRHFPLLLGLLLAVVIAWPTYRQVSLAGAMRLLSPEDADNGRRQILWQEYGAPSPLGWPLLVGAVIGFGWIGLATAGAAASPLEGGWGAVTSGVGGALAFAGGLGYRVYALRRVQRLKSSGAELW